MVKCKTCAGSYAESVLYKSYTVCPRCGHPCNIVKKAINKNANISLFILLSIIAIYFVSWYFLEHSFHFHLNWIISNSFVLSGIAVLPLLLLWGRYAEHYEKKHGFFLSAKPNPEIQQKLRDELNTSVPENPDRHKSYMDETTGDIVLYSYDFPEKRSSSWTISDGAIKILEKPSNKTRMFSLGQIYDLQVKGGLIPTLSFQISGKSGTVIAGSSAPSSLDAESIYLHRNDLPIVEHFQKYFAEFSAK